MTDLEKFIQAGKDLLSQENEKPRQEVDVEAVREMTDKIQAEVWVVLNDPRFTKTQKKLFLATALFRRSWGKNKSLSRTIEQLQKERIEEIQWIQGELKEEAEIRMLPRKLRGEKKTNEIDDGKGDLHMPTLRLAWAKSELDSQKIKYEIEPSIKVAGRKYDYTALIPENENLNVALVSIGYGEATYFLPREEWKALAQIFKRDLRQVTLKEGELYLELMDNQLVWQEEFWKRMNTKLNIPIEQIGGNYEEPLESYEEYADYLVEHLEDFAEEADITFDREKKEIDLTTLKSPQKYQINAKWVGSLLFGFLQQIKAEKKDLTGLDIEKIRQAGNISIPVAQYLLTKVFWGKGWQVSGAVEKVEFKEKKIEKEVPLQNCAEYTDFLERSLEEYAENAGIKFDSSEKTIDLQKLKLPQKYQINAKGAKYFFFGFLQQAKTEKKELIGLDMEKIKTENNISIPVTKYILTKVFREKGWQVSGAVEKVEFKEKKGVPLQNCAEYTDFLERSLEEYAENAGIKFDSSEKTIDLQKLKLPQKYQINAKGAIAFFFGLLKQAQQEGLVLTGLEIEKIKNISIPVTKYILTKVFREKGWQVSGAVEKVEFKEKKEEKEIPLETYQDYSEYLANHLEDFAEQADIIYDKDKKVIDLSALNSPCKHRINTKLAISFFFGLLKQAQNEGKEVIGLDIEKIRQAGNISIPVAQYLLTKVFREKGWEVKDAI